MKPLDPKQAGIGEYIGLDAVAGHVYVSWAENLPAPDRPATKPRPINEGKYNDTNFPSGPTAMLVGVADFRAPAGPKRRGAP